MAIALIGNTLDYQLTRNTPMSGKFEVYKDVAGGHRWRLKASNGEIVAISESYTTRYSAKESAQKVKSWADTAVIVEIN